MRVQQVLDLVNLLPAGELRRLFDAGRPLAGTDLKPGLYCGRNGGMPAVGQWVARHLVKRDWFAKLVLDGWGVNVRCEQDPGHGLRPSPVAPGGVVVDLPFRLTAAGLDYGWHVLGVDVPVGLQFRDLLATVAFTTVATVAPGAALERVGAAPCESGEGELIVGLLAPLAIPALATSPFGMVWDHAPTPGEEASAYAYRWRRRVLDTSGG